MWEVICKRDFHGRLFPHAKEGDVKVFESWPEIQQLMAEAPTHFQWRKLPEVEQVKDEQPSGETLDSKQDSVDQPEAPAPKGKAKGKAKKE